MAIEDKTELTIDLDPRTARRVKDIAARCGISPGDYSRQAIQRALRQDAPEPPDPQAAEDMRAVIEKTRKLRKELYGDRVFPDSTPLFREMRGYGD